MKPTPNGVSIHFYCDVYSFNLANFGIHQVKANTFFSLCQVKQLCHIYLFLAYYVYVIMSLEQSRMNAFDSC